MRFTVFGSTEDCLRAVNGIRPRRQPRAARFKRWLPRIDFKTFLGIR